MSIQITGAGIYLTDKIEKSKSTAQIKKKSEDFLISKTGDKFVIFFIPSKTEIELLSKLSTIITSYPFSNNKTDT